MSDQAERWTRVGNALRARLSELRWTKAELHRASGISDKSLIRYLAGEPITRVDKRRAMTDAIGWTPGSIDAVLNGGKPSVVRGWKPPSAEGRQILLGDPAQEIYELVTAVRDLTARVTRLEQRVR